MKNILGLVVAIIGLAFFASCENEVAADQTQEEVVEQLELQEVVPVMDSVSVDSTK